MAMFDAAWARRQGFGRCEACGMTLVSNKRKYCSNACRQAKYRHQKKKDTGQVDDWAPVPKRNRYTPRSKCNIHQKQPKKGR